MHGKMIALACLGCLLAGCAPTQQQKKKSCLLVYQFDQQVKLPTLQQAVTTHFGTGAARQAVTSVEIGQSDPTAGHKYTHAIRFELLADQEPVFRSALAAFEQDLSLRAYDLAEISWIPQPVKLPPLPPLRAKTTSEP